MNVISGERGTGRTTKLVKRSYETGYPILVSCSSSANYIKKIANDLSVVIPEPIIYHNNTNIFHGIRKVIIDNADYLLQQILGISIDTYSIEVNEGEE